MTYQPPPCPVCGAWTEVLETRRRQTGAVARRIECANLHRFTDYDRQPVQAEQQPVAKPEQAAPEIVQGRATWLAQQPASSNVQRKHGK